jgi:hypothetical protein
VQACSAYAPVTASTKKGEYGCPGVSAVCVCVCTRVRVRLLLYSSRACPEKLLQPVAATVAACTLRGVWSGGRELARCSAQSKRADCLATQSLRRKTCHHDGCLAAVLLVHRQRASSVLRRLQHTSNSPHTCWVCCQWYVCVCCFPTTLPAARVRCWCVCVCVYSCT